MRTAVAMLVAASASVAAMPASAQNGAVRASHDAFAKGDLAAAERVLIGEQRVFPNSPEVLVNLAAVYARTGRAEQAATLYRQVLAQDAVLLDLTADRTVSSHAIAELGMRRLGGLQTAAR